MASNIFHTLKGIAFRQLKADVPARNEDIDSAVEVTNFLPVFKAGVSMPNNP